MRFLIHRTTDYPSKYPPCKGAYKHACWRIDEGPVDAPGRIRAWYGEGINHRVENGCIKRDFPDSHWAIDIDSLDALVALADAQGDIIVLKEHVFAYYDDDGPLWHLEIYDCYRE